MSSCLRIALLLGCWSPSAALLQPAPRLSRRAVLTTAAACASVGTTRPASAALTTELRELEDALKAAGDSESTIRSLGQLRQLSESYNGMPTDALRAEVVEAMRAKRDRLRGSGGWDGILEEAYQRVMRVVDPWRVVELRPIAQGSVIAFGPVYLALLAVQRFVPKVFNQAYAAGAALVFAPLLFQLITG